METYIGLLSEVLDVTQKNQIEVDAYVKIAKRYSGSILELGSGSGHLSLELAREGLDVTCLELHRDMIHLHKSKLNEVTEKHTTIVLGDMCSFELNRSFDLIIASHNVIHHLMDKVEFLEMLTSVKKHLTDLGVFIIAADNPNVDQMKLAHGIEKIKKYQNPQSGRMVEERVTPFYNFKTHTETKKMIVTEFRNERIKRRVEILNEEKFWRKNEITELVKAAGMSVILESGSINQVEPFTDTSDSIVIYIKK
jgi:2-polyprenyl-3-methyl-5-hydroxy-6-metoxy-1,4-benzoquinol methylase